MQKISKIFASAGNCCSTRWTDARDGVNTQCVLTPPKLFGSLKTDVSLLAVSISSIDARYALPINAVQFLKTAGLRIWNSIVVYHAIEAPTRGAPLAPFSGCFSCTPTGCTPPHTKCCPQFSCSGVSINKRLFQSSPADAARPSLCPGTETGANGTRNRPPNGRFQAINRA